MKDNNIGKRMAKFIFLILVTALIGLTGKILELLLSWSFFRRLDAERWKRRQ